MRKIIISFFFSLLISITILNAQPNPFSNGFHLGTFHFPNLPGYRTAEFFQKYSQLRYNSMIGYISHCNWDGYCGSSMPWGGFNNFPADYIGNYNNMISGFNTNYNNNFQLILEREKIIRAAYGQSSRYESEYTPSELDNGSIRPAYGFKTVYGNVYQDPDGTKGRVLYAGGTQGYNVKGMYENLEQVNIIDNTTDANSFNL